MAYLDSDFLDDDSFTEDEDLHDTLMSITADTYYNGAKSSRGNVLAEECYCPTCEY